MDQSTRTENKKTFWTRTRIITFVVILGFFLRLWAAWQLPVDFDEPTYMEAGYHYAQLIQDRDLNGIIDYTGSSEHPPLSKLIYGLTLLILGRGTDWNTALFLSRMVSVVFGSLAVLVLASIDPLAGGFLAVQTLVVKYSSQVYLEAMPLFFSLMAVALLIRYKPARNRLLILSAIGLGIAGAGKYSYFPIVFVILYLLIWEKSQRFGKIVLFFLLAGITFIAFNPFLWHASLERLLDSIRFHAAYAQGSHVQEVNYPWYQPFLWVSRSHGFLWHPDVFFYLGIDGFIFLLSLPGLYFEWKHRKWVVIWILTGMLSLLIWPTKWPQYTLVVLPAYCLAASTTVGIAYNFIKQQELYWEWLHNMFPKPARRYVIIASVLLGLLFVGALGSQVVIAINRIGWSSISKDTSGLPNNAINSMISLPDGQIVIGTDSGVAFWRLASSDQVSDEWKVFTPENSPLPNPNVLSVAQDMNGDYWFGTAAGLAKYDGASWKLFRSSDFDLPSEQINTIAVDRLNRVWVGTLGGAAAFDGIKWERFVRDSSGLTDDAVFSLVIEPYNRDNRVWFGTLSGVSRFDPVTKEWMSFNRNDIDLGWGGVSDLFFDSIGRLWVCTEGGGISLWDGDQWIHIKVSNSKLPYSIVETVAELEPGVFWIAASIPNTAGGVLVKYDGSEWYTFRKDFSGYSGAETVAIAKDTDNRYWFGTRTNGIDIYKKNH